MKAFAHLFSIFFLSSLIISLVFADTSKNIISENLEVTAEERLDTIDKELQEETQKYFKAQEIIQAIESKIRPLADKKATLQNQLDLFDEQLTLADTKIQNVEIQMNQKRLEIAKLEELLERAEIEIDEEKALVFDYIKELYLEEKRYFDDSTASPELIKLLLSEKTISRSMQEIEFLKIMESLGEEVFHHLEEANEIFFGKKEELELKKVSLSKLKNTLEKEQYNLLIQKQAREKLFTETSGKEGLYQKLLEKSKEEEGAAINSVASLTKNKEIIEEKLLGIQEFTSEEKRIKQKDLLKGVLENPITLEEYSLDGVVSDKIFDSVFMWPVSPERGISAYYLDKDYESYFGKKHGAIDVRASQGTAIYAPGSAYVQEVVDNGTGYSYILLAHKNGLSTLYGHVSEILVTKGQLIQLGTIIGKTGGTPGTQGAGLMTTGPHLHFEVHKNGKSKNPLDFLPTQLLP
ncbi:peptidoglycan DD-metalloendopeptidase family protein [Candidatus Peregrinibacteria bacterium]|jgi:murein DD-endopeptidase MepM/ murein hydrolase activator NlpD|nr:peptidoglycan DD-metalloendopeptidase family protein [Candidatus Peregrinibacteria bacterium]